MVVLGAAGAAAAEVDQAAARAAGVPIRRRRGGGGTVLLTPGQAEVALVTEVDHPYRNRAYAHAVNDWFIAALRRCGVQGVEQCGISDLAIAGRKIAGSSTFRRRRVLFFQASLLVNNDPGEFERYLPLPARAPAYRRGRGHREFCTTLAAAGYPLAAPQVCAALRQEVAARLPELR